MKEDHNLIVFELGVLFIERILEILGNPLRL